MTYPLVKTVEPWLNRADEFSLHQLERLEGTLAKPYQTVMQLPYALLDKTLDVGEGTLEYWLPVEEEKKLSKKVKQNEEDKSLAHLQSRAFNILDAFQLRAKDRLYAMLVVSRSVDFVSARARDAKALGKRVVSLPSSARLYYRQRRDQLVAWIAFVISQLRLKINAKAERVFALLHDLRMNLDNLRSLTLQDLGIGLVNRVHDLWQALYARVFPSDRESHEKDQASATTAEKEKEPQRKVFAPPRKQPSSAGGKGGRGRGGKQIGDDTVKGN